MKKPKSNSSIVIVGSGLAGYTLARELRKADTAIPITVITADNGAYYSKPQLSSAFSNKKTAAQLALFSAEKFSQQFSIAIVPYTQVLGIDTANAVCLTLDKPYAYRKLILACGATPLSLPKTQDVFQVNNLAEYHLFRDAIVDKKHIAIIGAGLVGCEFANDLLTGGYQVTIISQEKTPLSQLIPEVAGQQLQNALSEKGAAWRLEETIVRVEPNQIYLKSGEVIAADAILCAIGIRPNTFLAQQAGIKINRGICVDQYLATSHNDIYALGDCAEVKETYLPYVAPLSLSARALTKTLLGEPTPVIYPPMPIYVKTPAYPIVSLPPSPKIAGTWQIEAYENSVKASYYDSNSELRGFALTGKAVTEAPDWIKKVLL